MVAKQYPVLALYPSLINKLLRWAFIPSFPFHTQLQGKGPGGPPPTSLIYSINPERVNDLEKLGKPIAGMCRGIPTYTADQIEGK